MSLLIIAGGNYFVFTNSKINYLNKSYCKSICTKERIQRNLTSLSVQEKKDIETLFRSLFLHQGFAYTLFDERPLAYTAFFTSVPSINVHCGRLHAPENLWWKTWEKYQHLFPMKRFALIAIHNQRRNSMHIYLVNKKLYFEVLEKAHPETQWVINSGRTLKELADIFRNFKIEQLPNYHEVLGILLGFGENNANLFYRRDLLENILTENDSEYGKAVIMQALDRFQNELDQINNTLTLIYLPNTCTNLQMVYPIGFLVDDTTEETKNIKHKFYKARNKISALYSKGDFLEITLERLMTIE